AVGADGRVRQRPAVLRVDAAAGDRGAGQQAERVVDRLTAPGELQTEVLTRITLRIDDQREVLFARHCGELEGAIGRARRPRRLAELAVVVRLHQCGTGDHSAGAVVD